MRLSVTFRDGDQLRTDDASCGGAPRPSRRALTAAILAGVFAFPLAASVDAAVDRGAGRAASRPAVWAVELGPNTATSASPALFARMHAAGINVVVHPTSRSATLNARVAAGARHAGIKVVRPVAPPLRESRLAALSRACGSASGTVDACAVSVSSVSEANAWLEHDSVDWVVLHVASPAAATSLKPGVAKRARLLAVVRLGRIAKLGSAWQAAVSAARRSATISFGVLPESTEAHGSLDGYLELLKADRNRVAITPAPAAPSQPSELAVLANGPTFVTVAWSPASTDAGIAGYDLFVNGVKAGTTTASSGTLTTLACQSRFEIGVEAFDRAGRRSPRTLFFAETRSCPDDEGGSAGGGAGGGSPTPPDTVAPTAPTGIVQTSTTPSTVQLTWSASTDAVGVVGYGVYRAGTLVATVAAPISLMSSLDCGTAADVGVDAADAAGNRSATTSFVATTAACPASDTTVPAGGDLAGVFLSPNGSDDNACTRAAPCQSFDRAYRVAGPGAVVEVAGGSYPAQRLTTDASKTSSDDVVFRPASGASVVLADLTVLADHLELRDLTVDNSVSTRTSTDDVTLRNLDMLGIFLEGSSNVSVLGGRVHCGYCNYHSQISAEYGVNVAPTNILIDGVLFEDWQAVSSVQHTECLQIGGGDQIVIRNSTFRQCATSTPSQATASIHVSWYGMGPVTKNVLIENNFIYRSGNAFSIQAGDYHGLRIRYNSIVGPIVVFAGQGDGIPVEITGNILRYTAGMCDGQPYGSGPTAPLTWRYNVLSGGTCGATDQDAASGYANPDTDLHLLAGAAAIDGGDPTSYPPTDIDGNTRPAGGTPDAGAHER